MKNKELSIRHNQEYKAFIVELKERVCNSQLKAAIKVNYELLDLYRNLGKEIVSKKEQYAWGDSFIQSLSKDLKIEFPDMNGFSVSNLKYIRRFYLFYEKSQRVVDQLQNIISYKSKCNF